MTPVTPLPSDDLGLQSVESGDSVVHPSRPADSEPRAHGEGVGRAPGQTWIRQALAWALLAIAPVAVVLAYGVERFFTLSGADPFIYIGYASSTADLIERLGYPYYAVRFGLIIPSNLFLELFGPTAGYYLLRWLLTVVASAALYAALRRSFGWRAGAIAVALLLISPIYLRAMMTLYSTTVGVPAIAAGFGVMLMRGSTR